MPSDVFESWKGPSLTRGREDSLWRAVRTFNAAYYATKSDALNALAAKFGVVVGSQHPENSRLICDDIQCGEGYNLREIVASYAIRDGIGDIDPLNWKTRWRWLPSTETTPTDRDVFDNVIANAVGIPFDQLGQRFDGVMNLQATRNEPFYDAEKALFIQNKTNSQAFTVKAGSGTKTVEKGQAQVVNMLCESDVTEDSPYATVTYNIRFKRGRLIPDLEEYDSFFDVRLNAGDAGYMMLGVGEVGIGLFCNKDGMLIGNTLLDITGKPIDEDVAILSLAPDGTSTIGIPLPVFTIPPEVGNIDYGDRVYLCFRQYEQYDISEIGL